MTNVNGDIMVYSQQQKWCITNILNVQLTISIRNSQNICGRNVATLNAILILSVLNIDVDATSSDDKQFDNPS
jgi:hypothetical protein